MNTWPIQIKMQTGWDLWLLVCVAAAVVLLSYALFARLWQRRSGWVSLGLIAAGVGGTALFLFIPRLHSDPPFAGMAWTFLLLVILSTVFYLNLRAHLGPRRTGVLLIMRTLALAMMVPMLFDPVWERKWQNTPERKIYFVIDASGSMSVPDKQNGLTRIQSVWQAIDKQVDSVRENFVPAYFTFSTGLQPLAKPEDLARVTANGVSTDIVNSMKDAFAKTSEKDAIFILITDGIDIASPSVVDGLKNERRPIHTVRVGSDQAQPGSVVNVAVESLEAPEDVLVGHEAKIKVNVKALGLAGRLVDLKMAEVLKDGKLGPIRAEPLLLEQTADGQQKELPFTTEIADVHRLRVWIDKIPGERTDADNTQECELRADKSAIRVLYIEGRVRPEYKPLKNAFSGDSMIQLSTLLRTTTNEFKSAENVKGQHIDHIPATLEEWKKFDVVVIGDLKAEFLAENAQMHQPDRLKQIEQYVRDGGGLLMLGGENTLGPGGYKGTAVESILPVEVGDGRSAQEMSEFVPRLTAEGDKSPPMEGLREWFGVADDIKPTKVLPALRGNVIVGKLRGKGSEIWLYHPGSAGPDGKPQIVLATMLVGRADGAAATAEAASLGRSAVFTADTTYRWSLPLAGMGRDSPFQAFWGQLVRWLARADVRDRERGAGIDAYLNKNNYLLGDPIHVRISVRDQKGNATDYAQVSIKLHKAGSKDSAEIELKKSPRIGAYTAAPKSGLDKGDWVMEISATKEGQLLGQPKELKFTVMLPIDEMADVAARPKVLADLAAATRGYNCDLAELPRLVERLIKENPKAVIVRQEIIPLSNVLRLAAAGTVGNPTWNKDYDLPMQAGVVFALLVAEWMLRRRWQLP